MTAEDFVRMVDNHTAFSGSKTIMGHMVWEKRTNDALFRFIRGHVEPKGYEDLLSLTTSNVTIAARRKRKIDAGRQHHDTITWQRHPTASELVELRLIGVI